MDNSAKLSMTECGLAVVIESVENDSEEIVTIKVPVMSSVRNIDKDMKWKKILRKMLLLLMTTLLQVPQKDSVASPRLPSLKISSLFGKNLCS